MLSKYAKWPKKSKQKRISALLCSILLISAIAGAAVVAPVPVFALSAGGIKGTIASIVLSLLLQTGTAPVNTEWLTSLNAAYGAESTIGTIEQCISNGLLTQTAEGLVDTGLSAAIEAAPEYSSLGLSDLFTTTAADVGVTAASGGVNLATTAINVGTLGTIGAFAGAAAVGVGVGVLANKFYNWAKDSIKAGISYFRTPEYLASLGPGATYASLQYKNSNNSEVNRKWLLPEGVRLFGYYTEDGRFFSVYQASKSVPYEYYDNEGTPEYKYRTRDKKSFVTNFNNLAVVPENIMLFDDSSSAYSAVQGYINGNYTPSNLKSPDIITPSGNAQMIEGSNGADIVNGLGNIVPAGYDMTPVDVEDYLRFADDANDNTQNGDTGQDTQGEAFDNFVDPYIIPQEQEQDQPIIPENPDIPNPEYPDRPLIPDQPTVPDKPDPTPEDITDMTDMMTTSDLKSVFPFCIPWDLYNLFHIFDTGENRRAPHIEFTFPGTDWHIDVDLAQFDPVAALLRLLELIVFIAGLAVATRALIGANG